MNLVTKLTGMVEEYRKETKNPCKNYATEAAAERATAKAAQNIANYFMMQDNAKSADYLVVYIKDWGRWVGFINMSEVLNRQNSRGGYLGIEPGFFKF